MSLEIEKYRPVARLLLRLMGIFFFVNGATGIVSNGLDEFWNVQATQRDYRPWVPGTSAAWALGSLFMVLAGLYLIFRGAAVLDALFHESLSKRAIPCPDCGYDLRATLAAKKCPECGATLAADGPQPDSEREPRPG